MSEPAGVTFETDRAGRRVAIKHVPGPERARAEATLLQSVGHPGVVEVLRLDENGALVLGFVDGPRLADVTLAPAQLAAVVAAAATTVAELHAGGIVHGALRAEHVLLDGGSTPRLCGFGTAASRPAGASAAADVYDLALLLRDGVARWRHDHADAPRDVVRLADVVDGLARRVVVAPPNRRPSARALAADLARLPGVRLPGAEPATPPPDVRSEPDRVPVPHRLRRLRPATAAAVVCIAVSVVTGALALRRLHTGTGERAAVARVRPPTPSRAPVAALTTIASTTVIRSTTSTAVDGAVVTSSPAGCAPVAGPALVDPVLVDPDGDGCGEPARLDGRRVRTAGGLFEVGEDGDAVALGDWDCDGLATLAVLRPATGRVFVFGSWPATAPLPGAGVATVAGGTAVHAVRGVGSACDQLVVERVAGPVRVVEPGRAT